VGDYYSAPGTIWGSPEPQHQHLYYHFLHPTKLLLNQQINKSNRGPMIWLICYFAKADLIWLICLQSNQIKSNRPVYLIVASSVGNCIDVWLIDRTGVRTGVRMGDWLIDWLIDWSIVWTFVEPYVEPFVETFVRGLIDRSIDWSYGRL
jgi:hypothetical protein